MSRLPPRARLERVLNGLAKQLPAQLKGLIEAPSFDEERHILERFTDGSYVQSAATEMTETEAGWMADTLLERWAAIGDVVLDPVAAICAPHEVWLGKRPMSMPLEVIVEGLDEGWSATWQGDIAGDPSGPIATLDARPPEGPAFASARVRVEGRAGGKRSLLVDHAHIPLRVPQLVVSEDRTQFLVRDQQDRPAIDVTVQIGAAEHRTDTAGLIVLAEPVQEGTEVLVEGIRAGRIPPS